MGNAVKAINWMAAGLLLTGVWAASLSGCGDDETSNTTDPCPTGICGNSTSGSGAGGSGAGGSGAGGGCIEAWTCTPWETDGSSDAGTRQCIDANNCGTLNNKPVEAATLPALDENFYRCNVEPVFDLKCSQLACHGVEPTPPPGRALRIYHRGRLRITGDIIPGEPGCLNQPDKNSEDCIGSIECACWTMPHTANEWQRNFDSARGLAMKSDGTPLDSPDDSEILRQPLIGGGLVHAGIKMYGNADADYQIIREWLNGTTLANCATTN